MTPPNLTPEEKPQTLESVPYDDKQQGSDFSPKSDAIDVTGKPLN